VASKTVARHEQTAFAAAPALVEVEIAVLAAVGSVEDGVVEDAAAVDAAAVEDAARYGPGNQLNGGRHDQD
jgi:hypothetical protein